MAGFTLRQVLVSNDSSLRWNADSVALVFGDERRTYGDLATSVDETAAGLAERGFVAGDTVLALLPNCIEYVELFFAVASLGGVMVPTNYLLNPHEVAHVQQDSEARWIVVHERFEAGISLINKDQVTGLFCVGDSHGLESFDELRRTGGSVSGHIVDVNDVALLQYTSGTTGLPKAAIHTHSTLMYNMLQQIVEFELTAEDTYVCVPALCWAAGFHDFTLPVLWRGGTVVLTPSQAFDPRELARTIQANLATIVIMVPSVLRMVLDAGVTAEGAMSTLRLLAVGGEAVSLDLLDDVRTQLPNVWLAQAYGMTEGPMIAAALPAEDAKNRPGSTGKALCLTEFAVVDPCGQHLPPGEAGEILLRSPATMLGYHRAPEKTAGVLRDGWFHTGDGGYLDADGYLYIAGRLKDMYITGGLNVYPAEVERVLLRHPAIVEAAVIPVPDARLGEVGLAAVVAESGAVVPSVDELTSYAREFIATYKVPRDWVIALSPLPRTTSGKVKRAELKEWAAEQKRSGGASG